jgi:hypothetical protein
VRAAAERRGEKRLHYTWYEGVGPTPARHQQSQ